MSDHEANLIVFPEDAGQAEAFVVICACSTASPPFPTKEQALRWATEHGASVSDGVEVLSEEGGVGWGCMFCGATIEEAPLRLSVRWTDEGVDDEQWFASHRDCLVQRMSQEERFLPRFAR